MPADLDLLRAFTDAITGESVSLPTPRGTLTVPKMEFGLAFDELAQLRAEREEVDDGAEYTRAVTEGLVDLVESAEAQGATAIPTEMLSTLLEGDVEEEAEQDTDSAFAPQLVDTATMLLRSLGVDANEETGDAFLAALAKGAEVQGPVAGRHRAEPEPDFEPVQELTNVQPPLRIAQSQLRPMAAPKVRLRGTPPAAGRRAMVPPTSAAAVGQSRAHPILPASGVPLRATPRIDPNKNPITAEQLFGLTRSPSGKYDAGALEE